MKLQILFLALVLGFSSFSQIENQTESLEAKKTQVKHQFNIYEQDHRGFVVYFSDQTQISFTVEVNFNTLQEAFQFYFSGGIMKDIVCVSINQSQALYPNFQGGLALDMNQSIEKYVNLFNQ